MLLSLGYESVRQRGSHVRLVKVTQIGEHHVTIPDHKILAKGTLSDILMRVSLWTGIPKEELTNRLR